jgi:6-phosphogluconate dehydrogenase
MEIAIIGLGKMGGNITRKLLKGGHIVHVYDPFEEAVKNMAAEGAKGALSLDGIAKSLQPRRVVWVMVPAGEPTESTVKMLGQLLEAGDIIIDGGNSNYKDSIRRAAALKEKAISLLDIGTSGGVWGITEGYCLMVGGVKKAYDYIEPILKTLAPTPDKGYGYVGESGAGHFVKMIHNGIEYGLMEAYAEGFELIKAKEELNLEPAKVAQIWRYGSVVRSWLLDLTAEALKENPKLENIKAYVEDSGEGRWAAQEAIELGVPTPIITQALQARFRSRQKDSYAARLLATLRHGFGGHSVKEEKKE